MMTKHSKRKELIMLPLLILTILLCIGGHFILQPNFQESHIAEYSLAALPFILFGIVIIAVRMAVKAEQKED
jgi:undecaprenyl pyrophosphate phosphatase UppP